MTTTPLRQSATIYQFPVGGIRGQDSWKTSPDTRLSTIGSPVIIDSWYHEEAMRDTKPQ